MTVWEEILSKHKCEGLGGEEPLKNSFCHKDKPFPLDCFWCTWSMKLMSRSITGKPGQRGSASQHLTLCRRRSRECLHPTASLGLEEYKQQWGYLKYYIFFPEIIIIHTFPSTMFVFFFFLSKEGKAACFSEGPSNHSSTPATSKGVPSACKIPLNTGVEDIICWFPPLK